MNKLQVGCVVEDAKVSLEDIQSNPNTNLFLIANHKNKKQILNLDKEIPGIKKVMSTAKSKGAQLAVINANKRKVVVVLLDSKEQAVKAVQKMEQMKLVDHFDKFYSLDLDKKD